MSDEDPRFSIGLVADVLDALNRHGYKASGDPRCYPRVSTLLLDLTRAYKSCAHDNIPSSEDGCDECERERKLDIEIASEKL